MSRHANADPWCPWDSGEFQDSPDHNHCQCVLIAAVRAEERERIAQAIEARAETHECGRAYLHAARIARNGGHDD